ncbi:hypothetical protein [Breoghania sp. JC706]|uniref:hypothetical protein n=1 Tax=Breoghania sp. JC706 TaxID=3117732 RepID=UPI003009E519
MSDPDDTTHSPADRGSGKPGSNPAGQSKRAAREERLAEALRANLKRRKQQQRGRKTDAQDGAD